MNSFPGSVTTFVDKKGGRGEDIVLATSNPFRQDDLDLEKVQDCANHFGKYPVKEIEKMRDGESNILHVLLNVDAHR
jgi:hypothetical protein